MKIKNVSCNQFAGLNDKSIRFEKGLNIVVGDNESGKSTTADLIYNTLFKDPIINKKNTGDKEFSVKYFPKMANSIDGDVIDGELTFETSNGEYTVRKEWSKGDGNCKMKLPNGTYIKDIGKINEIIKDELQYESGVFSEIIFPSQRNNQVAIESIMRELDKGNKRENLISTISQAALETGGVSLEKIESNIEGKLNALIARWDIEANAPEGGHKRASYKNAWSKETGEIVKAYYAVDEIIDKQNEAESAEKYYEEQNSKIVQLQAEKREIEQEKDEFQKFRNLILKKELIKTREKELENMKGALKEWPGIDENIRKAKELKEKKNQAEIRKLYNEAVEVKNGYDSRDNELKSLKEVEENDLENLSRLEKDKLREESKLSGMNISADIKLIGETSVRITSVATGSEVIPDDGEFSITEAVKVCIPGIMEMILAPQGIDIANVNKNINRYNAGIMDICSKYGVNGFDELSDLKTQYNEVQSKRELLKDKLEFVLGNKDWDDLKAENEKLPDDIGEVGDIEARIEELCGQYSLDEFLGNMNSKSQTYTKEYGSINELITSIEKFEDSINNQPKTEHIPEKYSEITDAEEFSMSLDSEVNKRENQINESTEELLKLVADLGEKSAEEYSEELQVKEAEFEAKKAEYQHWVNISKVFNRLKEEKKGNPVEDIEKNFNKYLNIITDSSLRLNSMDEKFTVSIESKDHTLSYEILSEGTKDTIALAFRLAMLEHIYPDGDGIAVFDDPFTDMDPKRVEMSCQLISKFAENNQVIFITCDDKYTDLMNGNVIKID